MDTKLNRKKTAVEDSEISNSMLMVITFHSLEEKIVS